MIPPHLCPSDTPMLSLNSPLLRRPTSFCDTWPIDLHGEEIISPSIRPQLSDPIHGFQQVITLSTSWWESKPYDRQGTLELFFNCVLVILPSMQLIGALS